MRRLVRRGTAVKGCVVCVFYEKDGWVHGGGRPLFLRCDIFNTFSILGREASCCHVSIEAPVKSTRVSRNAFLAHVVLKTARMC